MLYCLLSPAKKLDMESSSPISDHSTPALLAQTEPLIERVKNLTKDEIGELMKLSETQTLRVFNNDQGSAGHIHTYFNHGCSNQKIQLTLLEAIHNLDFFCRLEPTMNQPDLQTRQTLSQLLR